MPSALAPPSRGRLARLAVTAALLGTTGACGSSGTTTPGGATPSGVVSVVAAENVWGDITRQIGGARVKVTSIISDPDADPHTYETDPRDAAAIGQASFVILNGVGYDDFVTKLLDASPRKGRTIVNIAKVAGVTGDNPNPHLWYDPAYVKDAADAITAALSRADPADRAGFSGNEAAFLAAYQPYIDTLATIKASYAGTKVSYTERVAGYLLQGAGLVLGTPASFSQSLEDGNDPSPADTAAFDDAVRTKKVKVLLYNGQVTDAQTDTIKGLARRSGVPIVGVTETLPPSEKDFQTWQIDQARQILADLGG